MQIRKNAFTLTEVLVVVVLMAVLAAIVLPKFQKAVESTKTAEAERIMTAVRSEQESRCTLDDAYITDDITKLSSVKNTGDNFEFTLLPTGIQARSLTQNFTLKMPSYYQGRICCTGADCTQLNKSYEDCGFIMPSSMDLSCQGGNLLTMEDPTVQGQEPSVPQGGCSGDRPASEIEVCSGCGSVVRNYECINGSWEGILSGECVDSPEDQVAPCSSVKGSTWCGPAVRAATCSSQGTWVYEGDWDDSGCENNAQSGQSQETLQCMTEGTGLTNPYAWVYRRVSSFTCEGSGYEWQWRETSYSTTALLTEDACAKGCECAGCGSYSFHEGGHCKCQGSSVCTTIKSDGFNFDD